MIWASEIGHTEVVGVLLPPSPKHKVVSAKANAQDIHDLSALRYATANGHLPIVQMLLANGADSGLPDMSGKMPLIAVAWGRPFWLGGRFYDPSPIDRAKTVALLFDARADQSARDVNGNATVHYAADNGYLDILKALIT